MSLVEEILATIDAVDDEPTVQPPRIEGCCRDRCKRSAVTGHDFCAPCLSWLRFEVDDDPNATSEPPAPVLTDDEDDDCTYWVGYVGGYV